MSERRPHRPGHPRLAATLMMIGIVIFIVVVSAVSTLAAPRAASPGAGPAVAATE